VLGVPSVDRDESPSATINGVGVSPGVVEGIARVVTDPACTEVEPGEVLVTPATDPSLVVDHVHLRRAGRRHRWCAVHAAIVARELAVPCVVNTKTGSRRIRTGDRCRVDGTTGTVTILERAAEPITAHHGRDEA